MQLFVRGVDGRTRILEASGPSDSVNSLKELVESDMGIPVEDVRLTYDGKDVTHSDKNLGELGIEKDSNLQVHLRLLGGDDDDDELSSGSETESESEEDEDTGLTENQNRLLYMISLYTKKATPGTDEKDEWVGVNNSARGIVDSFPLTNLLTARDNLLTISMSFFRPTYFVFLYVPISISLDLTSCNVGEKASSDRAVVRRYCCWCAGFRLCPSILVDRE